MDIQIGDRVTYKYNNDDDKIYTSIIQDDGDLEDYKERIESKSLTILKIERPKYEVVEEKKKLLTLEEKEYLKNIIQPLEYKNLIIRKALGSFTYIEIIIDAKDGNDDIVSLPYIKNLKNLQFENLEEDKHYTLKELGLEE